MICSLEGKALKQSVALFIMNVLLNQTEVAFNLP